MASARGKDARRLLLEIQTHSDFRGIDTQAAILLIFILNGRFRSTQQREAIARAASLDGDWMGVTRVRTTTAILNSRWRTRVISTHAAA